MTERKQKRCSPWAVASLSKCDIQWLTAALAVTAFVRSFDYLDGIDSNELPDALNVVVSAAPLSVWVFILTVGALALTYGMVLKSHCGIWLGHVILGITYTTLGLGIILATLEMPYANGIRSGVQTLLVAMVHLTLAIRTGPVALRKGDGGEVHTVNLDGGRTDAAND